MTHDIHDVTCQKTDETVTISQGKNVIEFDSRQRATVLNILENGDEHLLGSSTPLNCGEISVGVTEKEVRLQQDLGTGNNTILTYVDKLTACLEL